MKGFYRQGNKFSQFLGSFLFIIILFFLVMVFFVKSDGDGYFGTIQGVVTLEASKLVQSAQEKMQEIQQKGKKGSVGKSGTNGVNLNLIDRINPNTPKKGYIKELLSIYRDSEKGKIYQAKLGVTTLLGMHTNEVGRDGKIPKYYFKVSEWKKDNPDYNLSGYTTKSFNKGVKSGGINENGGIGVFQHTGGAGGVKSNVDPDGNKRGASPGDCRFLPDMIATSGSKYVSYKNISGCKDSYLSKESMSIAAAMSNNRGEGGAYCWFSGVCPLRGSSTYLNSGKVTKSTITSTVQEVSKMYDDYLDEHGKEMKGEDVASFDDPAVRCSALIIASHYDDWYCNEGYYKMVSGSQKSAFERACKALYPKENSSDILKKIKNMCSDLPSSIKETTDTKVSSSDCKSVYGTSGNYTDGDYSYRSSSMWHVSKDRDTAGIYKHKYSSGDNPYYVSSFDYVAAGYTFSASSVLGTYVYAMLLKEAGVNSVDPTDPKTYMNQLFVEPADGKTNNGSTFKAGGGKLGTYSPEKVLVCPKLVDFDSLSGKRADVVNWAIQMAGSKQFVYSWGGRSTDKNNYYALKLTKASSVNPDSYAKNPSFYEKLKYPKYGLDCSGFVYACYNNAGVPINYHTAGGKTYAQQMRAGNEDWEPISWKELKPGDAMASGSHVVMYMGRKKGVVQTIESMGGGKYVQCWCFQSHTDKTALRCRKLKD